MDAREALARWSDDGLIAADLAERLAATLDDEEGPLRSFGLIELFVTIGALLIGGGLLLFIASQWDVQSPTRRLLLLVAIYGVVIVGAAVAERQRLATTARGLWFLSSIAVGVNIFLIGQIFHLPLNLWQGTLLWMLATLAMGWAAPSEPQGWLAVVLGVLTLGWLSVPSAEFFDQAAFLVNSAGIRPLLALIGVALAGSSLLVARTDFEFLQRAARVIGVAMIAVPLTISTFHPVFFAAMFEIDARLFHLLLAIVLVVVIGSTIVRTRSRLIAAVVGVVSVLLVALLPQVGPVSGGDLDGFDSLPWLAEPFDDSELLFGIYNALVFGLALATVVVGQRLGNRALVNTGVAVVGVLAMAFYIGRIAGALPTSVAFLLGGILLVAGAVFLERKRRDLVEAVSE